jgi:two-component system, sensor histidine kinase and response regulator
MGDEKPKVLIVDDVNANLVAMEALLENLDCQLIRADSGNEALRQLLKHEFALMLLDVQMPEMDGFEVARLTRENPLVRETPIVFVTAMHDSRTNIWRGYDAGAFDVLFKPVDSYVLRSKVQLFLDLFASRRSLRNEIAAHKDTLAELEAFTYSVSHDLRAPLRPLHGFSQALLEDHGDKLDVKGKEYLQRIRAAAERMGQLIDDMLKLSHVGQGDINPQSVDLSELVRSIVDELRAGEPARNVELVAPPSVVAAADARLMRIALENLVRNAWKFTRQRSRTRIELGSNTGDEGGVTYFVRDDGVGFDPTYAGKLFQPFQRLHLATAFEGTGIGLAIVSRIIRRHGGRVWAESEPDHGATFYFTLPARRPPP